MPTVQQQLSYVLNAPVPFFLTLVAAAIAIWSVIRWAYQWRYDGKIEKLEAMLKLEVWYFRIWKFPIYRSVSLRRSSAQALASALRIC